MAVLDHNFLIFPSGRRLYVHTQMIGISADSKELGYGADAPIHWPPQEWDETAADPTAIHGTNLTAEDMFWLAGLMIERWQKFRDALPVVIQKGGILLVDHLGEEK